ncbi:hypothetical protein VZT92_008376 [Zoarces viviparus]|uniref:Uncharacterized protein n=1 Tax=Zoarces viviparus TaxID=48416 RepID=A0AAW1FEZ0_ZOAVI
MENALAQLIYTQTQQAESLTALQDAMTTLGQHLIKPERPTEPSKVLTKQTEKFPRLPQGFRRSSCCMDGDPGACWIWLKKPGSNSHHPTAPS